MRWIHVGLMGVCAACGGTVHDDGTDASDANSDVGVGDASSSDAADANDGACPTPADVNGFTPSPIHAMHIEKGACTTAQIDAFYSACVLVKDCAAFTTANATCAQCLGSRSTDPTWGALVTTDAGGFFNATGCIVAVTGDSSATSCAQKSDDVTQCVEAACFAQCPVTIDSGIVSLQQCLDDAQKTACASYVADECSMDAGFYAECIASGSNNPEASFDAIGAAMCGP